MGWKGLINDPNLNGSFQINKGLRLARGLLLEIARMGLPTGTEFLDTISPQYTADLISWGAIGARTTESQVHRELSSGLSMTIGFKNGTDGSIGIAVDAIKSASSSHVFLSVTKQGISAIVETEGNDTCHVILRGANSGPNYAPEHVAAVSQQLQKAGLAPKIMIDCSHGNSEKKHENQIKVVDSIKEQLSTGNPESYNIMGCMLESNLVEGASNGRAARFTLTQTHTPTITPPRRQAVNSFLGSRWSRPGKERDRRMHLLADDSDRPREASRGCPRQTGRTWAAQQQLERGQGGQWHSRRQHRRSRRCCSRWLQ